MFELIIFALLILILCLFIKFILPIIKIIIIVVIASIIAFCIFKPEIIKNYIKSFKNELTIDKNQYNIPTRLDIKK